jgi:hypothetical protein
MLIQNCIRKNTMTTLQRGPPYSNAICGLAAGHMRGLFPLETIYSAPWHTPKVPNLAHNARLTSGKTGKSPLYHVCDRVVKNI